MRGKLRSIVMASPMAWISAILSSTKPSPNRSITSPILRYTALPSYSNTSKTNHNLRSDKSSTITAGKYYQTCPRNPFQLNSMTIRCILSIATITRTPFLKFLESFEFHCMNFNAPLTATELCRKSIPTLLRRGERGELLHNSCHAGWWCCKFRWWVN